MNYNIASNIAYCHEYVESIIGLIYYSHALPAAVSLVLGLFVFLENRKSPLGRILLGLSVVFSLWAYLNFTIWTKYDVGGMVMFAWAPIELLGTLLFFLALYFVYVFIEEKDIGLIWKTVSILFLLPLALFAVSPLNLEDYDIQECVATEGSLYQSYLQYLKAALSLLIFAFPLYKLFISKKRGLLTELKRRQIMLLSLGTIVFIYVFMIAGYISQVTLDYRYELYGLFGMIVFVGTLAYLIVRYQAFDIKLIGAQALVVALTLLVASQLLFVRSPINIILTAITLSFTVIFGLLLIRSVKHEIRQREEIEGLAEKLKRANKRLRELDRQKSEFVSIASHQLRSPLTAIRGYASMLKEGSFGKVPKKAEEAIDRIHESSRFMALSIEDFLNVSRIEQGRMKYELSDFNLKDVAERVVDEMRSAAIQKGLVLMFRSDCEGGAIVNADIGKVRQVLYNLVDNAMKYTPKGTITVIAHDDVKKKKMFITIHDTGVGMSKETLAAIFEKFVRAKNANAVNVSGTGLGLFVAKQMIEAMGGSVTPHSEGEGKGSAFTIELPLA